MMENAKKIEKFARGYKIYERIEFSVEFHTTRI